MIKANNPNRTSWIPVEKGSDFPIQNIPFGVFTAANESLHIGTRIGNTAISLDVLQQLDYLADTGLDQGVFAQENLNAFLDYPKSVWRAVRDRVAVLFDAENNSIPAEHKVLMLFPVEGVSMQMPISIGDYTDFYSSRDHAFNVGSMFRDPNNALLPNWLHLPVGYHGRASSIILSNQAIHRPKGQQMPADADVPLFGPSKLLDFELEMAFITGKGPDLGDSISTHDAEKHIFGMVVLNDWSARDIQKWEYVPLGPFLAKSFASSMSPWIVTLDALQPYKIAGEKQDPKVLPYLDYEGDKNIDIKLEVQIASDTFDPHTVSKSNYKYMYWNMCQQLAHHTVNGCNINAGDMMASGTISGPEAHEYGSMLEISWRGTKPVPMPDGSERKFINDGDTVIMKGWCDNGEVRIGFGEVSTKVLPTK